MNFGQAVTLVLCLLSVTGVVVAQNSPAVPNDTPQSSSNLAGAIIYASDLERSIQFYTEVMGLKIVARVETEDGLAEVLLSSSGQFLNGMMLTLQPADDLTAATKADRAALGQLMFMSSSNSALGERIRDAGYEVTERDPQHFYASDPDGYRILIYELDPRILQAQQ